MLLHASDIISKTCFYKLRLPSYHIKKGTKELAKSPRGRERAFVCSNVVGDQRVAKMGGFSGPPKELVCIGESLYECVIVFSLSLSSVLLRGNACRRA